jgi:hypothetical protein
MISDKNLNRAATVLGLILTAAVAQNMHFNPRWYGDTGPGVGKLPREIVSGFMKVAYDDGNGAAAEKQYYTPKTIDVTPNAVYRNAHEPLKDTVREVFAEGLNVAVHHCVDAAGGQPAHEVVDMFRTWNGRIVWRKTIEQSLDVSCKASELSKPIDLGFGLKKPG